MKLIIVRQYENLTEAEILVTDSEVKAQRVAREEALKGNGLVFVRWYRGEDGQRGYLNHDGHSPVGKAW